jgi:hypothetical protein
MRLRKMVNDFGDSGAGLYSFVFRRFKMQRLRRDCRRLETLPETRGRFQMNVDLPIAFDGWGRMEVALLCADVAPGASCVSWLRDRRPADPQGTARQYPRKDDPPRDESRAQRSQNTPATAIRAGWILCEQTGEELTARRSRRHQKNAPIEVNAQGATASAITPIGIAPTSSAPNDVAESSPTRAASIVNPLTHAAPFQRPNCRSVTSPFRSS